MAPSHYLKQYGLIIKLINNVPWHLSQWIIIKWDWNLYVGIISPQAWNYHLFSSDNSFLCHSGKLIFIVIIFNPSGLLSTRGEQGTLSMCLLWPHHRCVCVCVCVCVWGGGGGGYVQRAPTTWRVSHMKDYNLLLKLKFGNGWLISNCCGIAVAKKSKKSIPVNNSNSNSNSRVFNSNSSFNSTSINSNSNSRIGIGIKLQFQFRNWINPNPGNW